MFSYALFLHKAELEIKIGFLLKCVYTVNLTAYFVGNEISCFKNSVVKKRNIACSQYKVCS